MSIPTNSDKIQLLTFQERYYDHDIFDAPLFLSMTTITFGELWAMVLESRGGMISRYPPEKQERLKSCLWQHGRYRLYSPCANSKLFMFKALDDERPFPSVAIERKHFWGNDQLINTEEDIAPIKSQPVKPAPCNDPCTCRALGRQCFCDHRA